MFNSQIICGWSWQRRCSFWISESLFCVPPAYNCRYWASSKYYVE